MNKQFLTSQKKISCKCQSKTILQSLQSVIKQLQYQLEHSLKMNEQKDQIIKILTEEKQFYEAQSKRNDQNLYKNVKQQLQWNKSLINGLKIHNKQLTEKNQILSQDNLDLLQKIKQKEDIFQIMQQKLKKIQNQKKILQKQWGQTLICVKNKIFELYNQKNHQNKRQAKSYDKKTLTNNIIKNQQKGKKQYVHFNGKNKVQDILKQIDQKLLGYEFLNMIQSKQLRKNVQKIDEEQRNKQNITLNMNIFDGKGQKQSIKNKKIPILKLSQLSLKDQFNNKQIIF